MHSVAVCCGQSLSCVQVICHPTAGHGGFLLDHAFGNQVLSNIQEVVLAGSILSKKDF